MKVLSYLRGLLILLVFLLAGELLVRATRLPLPGSVAGMLLLAGSLHRGLVGRGAVRPAAALLVDNMALLFVPPAVGLMQHYDLLRREWLPIAAAGVSSTLAVLLVVGAVQQRAERRG